MSEPHVAVVAPESVRAALELLFRDQPLAERDRSVDDLLAQQEAGLVSFDEMFVATLDGCTRGVLLAVPHGGRGRFVWPPVVDEIGERTAVVERTADRLLEVATMRFEKVDVDLAQVLGSPEDTVTSARLERNGFEHLADLEFMQRTLADPLPAGVDAEFVDETTGADSVRKGVGPRRLAIECSGETPRREGVRPPFGKSLVSEPYDADRNHARFGAMLEATYVGSRDCPGLEGRRSIESALASHRDSGEFEPHRWRLFRAGRRDGGHAEAVDREGEDVGILLLADHPGENAYEVVYMGVHHAHRGRGYGRRIVLEGLRAAREAGREALLLAVDAANHFARATYVELGFTSLVRRRVHVWFGEIPTTGTRPTPER